MKRYDQLLQVVRECDYRVLEAPGCGCEAAQARCLMARGGAHPGLPGAPGRFPSSDLGPVPDVLQQGAKPAPYAPNIATTLPDNPPPPLTFPEGSTSPVPSPATPALKPITPTYDSSE